MDTDSDNLTYGEWSCVLGILSMISILTLVVGNITYGFIWRDRFDGNNLAAIAIGFGISSSLAVGSLVCFRQHLRTKKPKAITITAPTTIKPGLTYTVRPMQPPSYTINPSLRFRTIVTLAATIAAMDHLPQIAHAANWLALTVITYVRGH